MKIVVIGAGQQGASIARALNDAPEHDVSIYDASHNTLDTFGKLDNTDNVRIAETSQSAIEGADVVILATPVDTFSGILKDNASTIKPGTIITDIGSGKVTAIRDITASMPDGSHYVPIHPINGKATPGPESSDVDMYKKQTIVAIPGADASAHQTVCDLWSSMGGKIKEMDAETHDKVYGTISHFEHVVAFAMTMAMEDENNPRHASDDFKNGGETLIATTRIAAGSADMWAPVFKDNKEAVLAAAKGFSTELNRLTKSLQPNGSDIQPLLQDAHEYRTGMEDDARENLQGEVDDQKLKTKFNAEAGHAMARRVSVPALIGAAITRNAMVTDETLSSVSIRDVANPSFKDGSAPMLSDPARVAAMLNSNKDAVLSELQSFKAKFDELVTHIENEDAPAIHAYIDRVNNIRGDDVRAKADPKDARPEYVIPAVT